MEACWPDCLSSKIGMRFAPPPVLETTYSEGRHVTEVEEAVCVAPTGDRCGEGPVWHAARASDLLDRHKPLSDPSF